ncbi:metal ABC transporter solute-binding protein, Zn/Mn family [Gracilinema caldarium]|uniref:ABC-type metal ion transporter, periplasmic subunit n=1 Tax=Gracilinema caldarium (strain ATCC 51460 / DSM 7334 / H1) TaxID=744872 RepID=F8F0Y9_GRAC1|nr:zinc ABC transporter substrate-binding protein [Gracilinema caldarium]AEJ20275.1 ABC-type metal ion transporter, periplasmic subunit [Gracilinema caldarium DSM 7334]
MKHTSLVLLTAIITLVIILGCAPKTGRKTETVKTKPIIAISILPHSYFLERIGGDSIQSLVLVGPGQSPHTYEPSPKQMEDLSKASAWIYSNTDFEVNLKPKIASLYPSLLLIDGTDGVQFRQIEAHHHEDEAETDDPTEEHHEMERDLHTWLGRENAKIFSRHVRDTLIKVLPEHRDLYESRYEELIKEIDRVFNELDQDLAPLKGTKVFVFHPSFGYFFDEFGIQQEAIETGGKEPSAKTLAQIIEAATAEQVKVIFVQAQFPTTAAKTVADSLGAQVVPLDPLAKDWMSNIKLMGESLKKAIK